MADLHRGARLSRLLIALRTFSPIQIERDALLCPGNLARKVFILLHFAAERFAAQACHELVKYWRSNNAEDIARYWSEIADWLPIGMNLSSSNNNSSSSSSSPYAKFYEAYRLEYKEGKVKEALDLYLEASCEHALAAYNAGRLMGRGRRLEGWKRYKGRTSRAVLSLQCLSIVHQLMGFTLPGEGVCVDGEIYFIFVFFLFFFKRKQ